jgi:hypothetical protein
VYGSSIAIKTCLLQFTTKYLTATTLHETYGNKNTSFHLNNSPLSFRTI